MKQKLNGIKQTTLKLQNNMSTYTSFRYTTKHTINAHTILAKDRGQALELIADLFEIPKEDITIY